MNHTCSVKQAFIMLAITAAFFSLLALPAAAEPQGIAFVNSPEQAHTSCFSGNMDKAFKCARKKCQKAGGDECLRVRWCYPAMWSGVMSINLSIGFHFPAELCGMPSKKALLATFEVMCRNWENASDCYVGSIFSPQGEKETSGIAFDPKK